MIDACRQIKSKPWPVASPPYICAEITEQLLPYPELSSFRGSYKPENRYLRVLHRWNVLFFHALFDPSVQSALVLGSPLARSVLDSIMLSYPHHTHIGTDPRSRPREGVRTRTREKHFTKLGRWAKQRK